MNDYFTLFRLSPSFCLDTEYLMKTYRQLAAQFHPDKFSTASSFEQKQAVMMSAIINQAYQVLLSPIDRAAYLLQQRGIEADSPEHTQFPVDFLMQQMQWREQLQEAKIESNEQALLELKKEIDEQQENLLQQLEHIFNTQDYDKAAQLVRQGRFLNKIQQEIQSIS